MPSPDETWLVIDSALRNGTRTLPGGWSLARLLKEHRGVRKKFDLAPLTEEYVLTWA